MNRTETRQTDADGSVVDTLTDVAASADETQVAGTVIQTSADSQTRTSSIGRDGDLTTDRVVVAQTSAPGPSPPRSSTAADM